jgi:ornithine carbamoyltransferase
MADAAGHEVVRLPVAHCTLNPIEMAWAQVKGYIKANNQKFNLREVERLAHEGFDIVTPERWTSLIKHVQDKVEDHYWEVNGLAERYSIREFTIHVRPDDDSSEESSSSDVDGDI